MDMIDEREVAERLGVTREEVREFRKQNMYLHVDFENGRPIMLTEDGVAKLAAHFGGEDIPEKTIRAGTVVKIFVPNTKFIEVELEGGEVGRVLVRDNSLFVKGQRVPVVKLRGVAVWRLGCRPPRARGRLNWNEKGAGDEDGGNEAG